MLNINLLLAFNFVSCLIGLLVGLAVAIPATFFVYKAIQKNKASKEGVHAKSILEEAKQEAKNLKKEAVLSAKEEAFRLTNECEQEIKSRRAEIQKAENRISQREEFLDKKEELIEKKNESVDKAKEELANKETVLNSKIAEQDTVLEKMNLELERISKLSRDDAKKELISKYEDEAKKDAAVLVREIESKAKEEANKKAKEIVTLAIQKTAVDHTSEVTVSTVDLPNDEVKGRIIGREGRNIRALESATGVDLIIDDTPEAVVLSSFDPVRREIARISLEKLIMDGRIHPARIEEMVEKVTKDIENTIKEEGEAAVFDAGIHGMHPELIKLLGRLKYRTSYGQNVLKHSLEVSYLSGLLAAEVGANVQIAKRGGLLHDIGKSIDHETEGTHITIGVDLATKYKESKEVIHCIAAHHGNVEFESLEAIIVQTADAISSSRPGARRESLEAYIKRLTQLEEIANGFKGVETSFAIQAGREIRIIVKPEEVTDEQALFMAKDIAKKIEKEMEYPGQIKVNVIRETRNVDYAK